MSSEQISYEVLSMGAGDPDVLRYALHDALDALSYFISGIPNSSFQP